MKFLVYLDNRGWRWKLYDDDGLELATSVKDYERKMQCVNAVCQVSNSDSAELEVEDEL